MASQPMISVLHATRCLPGASSYGGFHRTQQITETLAAHDISVVPLDFSGAAAGDRLGNLGAGWPLLLRRDFPGPRSYRRAWLAGRYLRQLRAARREHPTMRPVLLWENSEDGLLALAAAQSGLKVIALPHDLVALNRPAAGDAWRGVAEEIAGLTLARRIFTISSEEDWLLRLFGCASAWFPYHPPEAVRRMALAIRAQRSPRPEAPILILGSVTNPQTRAGMAHQLQLVRTASSPLPRKIIVAGNGSETFADQASPEVEIRGTVGEEELHELLASAAVLWAHQEAGTGALTRLVEALMAGLPVAGSGVALRSTAHLADVFPVESLADLTALLPALPACAACPATSPASGERLAEAVAGKSHSAVVSNPRSALSMASTS